MEVNTDKPANKDMDNTIDKEISNDSLSELAVDHQETNDNVSEEKDTDLANISASKTCDTAIMDTEEADMLKAAIEVEKTANIDESSNVSVTNPSFSQLECLQFQSHLLELVEELRMRRDIDDENKEKIKQLVKAQQQMETKYEEELEQARQLHEESEEKVADKKKSTQTEVADLQLQKARLISTCEMREHEIKALKDEMRALQLSRCNAEQRASELERSAQLQRCAHAAQHSQLSLAEQTTHKLKAEVQDLVSLQQSLRTQVSEAEKLNHQLSSIVLHQRCTERAQMDQITKAREEIVSLRVQLGKSDKEMNNSDNGLKIEHLQRVIKTFTDNEKSLNEKLELQTQQQQQATMSLNEAHRLLDRQSKATGEQRERAEMAEEQLTKVRQLQQQNDAELNTSKLKMDEMTAAHQDTAMQWKLQETSLMSRLRSLEHDHEHLMKTHSDMEQLNSEWATKNVQLTDELLKLKNKPKCDIGLQISVEMIQVTSQTDCHHLNSQQTQTVKLENPQVATQTEAKKEHGVLAENVIPTTQDNTMKNDDTKCLKQDSVHVMGIKGDVVECERAIENNCPVATHQVTGPEDVASEQTSQKTSDCADHIQTTCSQNTAYKFQFVSPNLHTPVPLANTSSKLGTEDTTTPKLKGIIQDVGLPKAKRLKRVSFSMQPPSESYPQPYEETPHQNEDTERNEEDLFSDGEQMDFDLGSQLERIQHILQ